MKLISRRNNVRKPHLMNVSLFCVWQSRNNNQLTKHSIENFKYLPSSEVLQCYKIQKKTLENISSHDSKRLLTAEGAVLCSLVHGKNAHRSS